SLCIVFVLLQQRATDTLHGATNNLAFDQHRIDHHATIVDDDIFLDFDAPDLNVDIDDGRMHRIRPGDRWWFVVECFLKTRIYTGRTAVIPARARRLCDLGERQLDTRYADDADTALTQL